MAPWSCLRLATLSLARNPGRAAVAVAFLAISLGLALFASVYRSFKDVEEFMRELQQLIKDRGSQTGAKTVRRK